MISKLQNFFHSINLSTKEKGMILAFCGYSAFSLSDSFGKYLSADYSVYQVTGSNYIIACVILLLTCRYLGGLRGFWDKRNISVQILRGILNFAISLQVIYSVSTLPLSSVYTMLFVMPFFAIIIGKIFFKDTIERPQIFLMVGGFAGVMLAFKPWENSIDMTLAIPLVCAVFIAIMFSMAKALKEDITVFALGFTPLFIAALINLPFLITTFNMPTAGDIPLFLASGLCVCCGIIMVSLAFRTVSSAIAAPFLYVEMIWALIIGYLIFGDTPDLWMMAGAAVIMGCGYILVKRYH